VEACTSIDCRDEKWDEAGWSETQAYAFDIRVLSGHCRRRATMLATYFSWKRSLVFARKYSLLCYIAILSLSTTRNSAFSSWNWWSDCSWISYSCQRAVNGNQTTWVGNHFHNCWSSHVGNKGKKTMGAYIARWWGDIGNNESSTSISIWGQDWASKILAQQSNSNKNRAERRWAESQSLQTAVPQWGESFNRKEQMNALFLHYVAILTPVHAFGADIIGVLKWKRVRLQHPIFWEPSNLQSPMVGDDNIILRLPPSWLLYSMKIRSTAK
jgi:hypothetical protein